tara:strand:- start:1259 stop:1531 length:273 start_codon:yes stop_codon:yes gene_type:complete
MCASANETAFATFSTFIYTYDLLIIILYIIMTDKDILLEGLKDTEKELKEQRALVEELTRKLDSARGDLFTLEHSIEFFKSNLEKIEVKE